MRHLRRIVVLLLCTLAAGCTSLLFYPTADHVMTPDVIGLDYRDVTFTASDGTQLHGWFLPAAEKPSGTIVFVHGNAENISTHIASVAWLPAEGFNVFQTNGACSGQVVPHVHFHVIPRRPGDGLGFRWNPGGYGDGEMDAWREKIAAAMT